jgi:hypothetical protein
LGVSSSHPDVAACRWRLGDLIRREKNKGKAEAEKTPRKLRKPRTPKQRSKSTGLGGSGHSQSLDDLTELGKLARDSQPSVVAEAASPSRPFTAELRSSNSAAELRPLSASHDMVPTLREPSLEARAPVEQQVTAASPQSSRFRREVKFSVQSSSSSSQTSLGG